MNLNRKGRRLLKSNKIKNNMEVTPAQKEAFNEIVKLMQENNLEFNVQHQVIIQPKQVAQPIQQAPKEEVKITDVK